MSSRFRTIAERAGLNPRVLVSGIDGALADALLADALRGDEPATIIASVGAHVIRDGYGRRALNVADATEVVRLVAQAKRVLIGWDLDAQQFDARREALRQALHHDEPGAIVRQRRAAR